MIFPLLMLLCVLLACAAILVFPWRRGREPDGDVSPPDAVLWGWTIEPGVSAPLLDTESELVRRLVAGELSPVRYRAAMERLAAQDAVRNPLVVPRPR